MNRKGYIKCTENIIVEWLNVGIKINNLKILEIVQYGDDISCDVLILLAECPLFEECIDSNIPNYQITIERYGNIHTVIKAEKYDRRLI